MTTGHLSNTDKLDADILNVAALCGNKPEDFKDDSESAVTAEDIIEATATNLWCILIRTIELYADHTNYTDWSLLSSDIGETFEQNKISEDDRTYLYSVIFGDARNERQEFIVMSVRAAREMESRSDVTMTRMASHDSKTLHGADAALRRAEDVRGRLSPGLASGGVLSNELHG